MQSVLHLRRHVAAQLRRGGSFRQRRPRLLLIRCANIPASGDKKASFKGRDVIKTTKAPEPLGAYSQGVKAEKLLFVGGQLGLLPGAKELVSEDPAEQAEQAMKNLGAILDEAGSSFDQVVKTTLLLSDINDFKVVNAVYSKYFNKDPPARVAFAAKALPLNARVEIDAIAMTD